MNNISRRGWLLGLVGAVFGASAARALERWMPPRRQAPEDAMLTLVVPTTSGHCFFQHMAKGKVAVEYDPDSGDLRVTEYDRAGRPIGQSGRSVRSVKIALQRTDGLTEGRAMLSCTDSNGTATTYTYDQAGRLTSVSGPEVISDSPGGVAGP